MRRGALLIRVSIFMEPRTVVASHTSKGYTSLFPHKVCGWEEVCSISRRPDETLIGTICIIFKTQSSNILPFEHRRTCTYVHAHVYMHSHLGRRTGVSPLNIYIYYIYIYMFLYIYIYIYIYRPGRFVCPNSSLTLPRSIWPVL